MIKPLSVYAPSCWCDECGSRLSIQFNCANWACVEFGIFNPYEYRRVNGR